MAVLQNEDGSGPTERDWLLELTRAVGVDVPPQRPRVDVVDEPTVRSEGDIDGPRRATVAAAMMPVPASLGWSELGLRLRAVEDVVAMLAARVDPAERVDALARAMQTLPAAIGTELSARVASVEGETSPIGDVLQALLGEVEALRSAVASSESVGRLLEGERRRAGELRLLRDALSEVLERQAKAEQELAALSEAVLHLNTVVLEAFRSMTG